jgi:uncharacterized membrane protein HdeD (DUF308 family)
MLLELMARNWWAIVMRGIVAILFGLTAWIWPGVTLGALVFLWGCYAFADGVLAIAAAFTGRTGTPWWALVLIGIVSIGAAAAALFFPGLTAVGLLYLMAFWAIATGALAIVAAIDLRREIEGEVWLALGGVLSMLFGAFLIARPGAGALAVVWLIGSYAVAFGAALIALGVRVKRAVSA